MAGMTAFGAGMSALSTKQQIDAARHNYKHRYRWTMADMRAAGLNPILAGQVGGGNTPQAVAADYSKSLGTAAQVASAGADMKLKKLQGENTRADTMLKHEQSFNLASGTNLNDANTALQRSQIPGAKTKAAFDDTVWGKRLRRFKRGTDAFNPLIPSGSYKIK